MVKDLRRSLTMENMENENYKGFFLNQPSE